MDPLMLVGVALFVDGVLDLLVVRKSTWKIFCVVHTFDRIMFRENTWMISVIDGVQMFIGLSLIIGSK